MEYEISGGNLPVVVCKLQQGESIFTQSGGMGWFSPSFRMSTNIKGGIFKGIGRLFMKESFFMTTYKCIAPDGLIAFPSDFPGSIIMYDLKPGESIIAQKNTFLCAESTVTLSMHFKSQLMVGLFSGEGFVMQKVTGPGKVFLDIDGSTVRYLLQPGEIMMVDNSYIASLSPSVGIKMVLVKGLMNLFFSGEGMFFIELTGPGDIILQTMPIKNLAKCIAPYLHFKKSKKTDSDGSNMEYDAKV